jgi:uncharacterized protein (DUF4415 family)
MSGLKVNESKTNWAQVRVQGDYVWDGINEDDRPASDSELVAAISSAKKAGRPSVEEKRPSLNMRVDADVLDYLRSTGKGWQTRVNALLRDAVTKHLV